MRRASAIVVLAAFVIALVPFALMTDQAEAAAACCQINANGTPRASGSFRCNLSSLETRRVGVGSYEVDFTPVATDIRNFARSATLDTQTTGTTVGEIGLADRAGDLSSVFVSTYGSNGALVDKAFDLCIH
jgi:hypothetical protein